MKIFKITVFFVLSIIIFIISWYSVSRIRSINTRLTVYTFKEFKVKKNTSEITKLKIASYNIAHGRGGKYGAKNWQYSSKKSLFEHLDKIVEQVKEEDPDIILLNEIDFSSAWSFNIDQAKYIGKKCSYPYILEQKNMDVSFPFYRFCFGNALLSRYPIENEKFIDFPPYSKIEDFFVGNHDAFFCELNIPSGTIGVFGIHFEYRDEGIRVKCAESLNEQCAGIKYPIIALGDFNSSPIGYPNSELSVNGMNAMTYLINKNGFISYLNEENSKNAYTFPSNAPDRLIDWIIGKGIGRFTNSKIIKSGLSDHLMIITEIELKKEKYIRDRHFLL